MPNLAPPARLPICRNIFLVLGPFLPLGFVAALFNYAACGATALPASLAGEGYVQRAKHYVIYYTSLYPTQHGRSYLFSPSLLYGGAQDIAVPHATFRFCGSIRI